MAVHSNTIRLSTQGFSDIQNITDQVESCVRDGAISNGVVTVAVPGSTATVTTIEYETGAVQDLKDCIERIAPQDIKYQHDARWGDGNGFSHVRSALMGPSISIPLQKKQMVLGTWQQIVFIDFDNRPRQRSVTVQIIGE